MFRYSMGSPWNWKLRGAFSGCLAGYLATFLWVVGPLYSCALWTTIPLWMTVMVAGLMTLPSWYSGAVNVMS